MNEKISVTLITRNRPHFFCISFSSLLTQSFTDWGVTIIDDSDIPLAARDAVESLLEVAKLKGHRVDVLQGENLGIAQAWQRGLEIASADIGYRMEDDIWLEWNNLGLLYSVIVKDSNIAAVGGMMPNILNPPILTGKDLYNYFYQDNVGNLIPDDMQRYLPDKSFDTNKTYEVSHLHGLFLYRKELVEKVGGFATHTSRVCHRDETDLTLRLWFAGYRLLVYPKALHYHFEAKTGGSRDDLTIQERTELQKADEAIFQERLKQWLKEHPEKKLPIRNS